MTELLEARYISLQKELDRQIEYTCREHERCLQITHKSEIEIQSLKDKIAHDVEINKVRKY
jgi:hypothetical protein